MKLWVLLESMIVLLLSWCRVKVVLLKIFMCVVWLLDVIVIFFLWVVSVMERLNFGVVE